jgi:ribosome-associated protein
MAKTTKSSANTKTGSEKKLTIKKAAKSTSLGRKAPTNSIKKNMAKSTAAKKSAAKKLSPKKNLSEKDLAQKEANRIINSSPKSKTAKRPVKSRTKSENTKLLDAIIDGLEEKKAKNITVMDLTSIGNSVADFFVIADAESRTHVEAIADSVEDVVSKKNGEKAFHVEGHRVGEWIIIDYINIVVHVFQKEIRDYYSIEALWADAEIRKVN